MPEPLNYPGLEIDADTVAWKGRFSVRQVRFRHRQFDGSMSPTFSWEIWERGPAVAVLPYDPVSDTVVLIEQFRLPALAAGLDPVQVEVPAGLCDPGEDAAVAARRETHEEIALDIRILDKIGNFLPSAGGSDERLMLFCGQVTAPAADTDGLAGHGGLPGEEDIRIRVWPADRAIAGALEGQIPNAATTLCLLWLAARRDALRARWAAATA